VTARGLVHVPPRWVIAAPDAVVPAGTLAVRLLPGPGFGDGVHPTTQLCLQAIAALAPRRPFRLLDFGSGSGILSVAAAAHLDAHVDAVEIDARAVEHADRNIRANAVESRVRQLRALDGAAPFDFVVANILRAVLLAHAQPLAAALAPAGTLVLSGLVSTDVPDVIARYSPLCGGQRPDVYARDEWRALVWRRSPS
jgi:ribosomal protein L11 methyltransferase